MTALDLKIFDPIGSKPGEAGERGGHVGFGNTEEAAHAVVLGRRERGAEAPGKRYNRHTGEGYVAPVAGDYARARAAGVTCVPLLVETFGGFGTGLVDVLHAADAWRQGKLTSSEYDETTWSAHGYLPFAMQGIYLGGRAPRDGAGGGGGARAVRGGGPSGVLSGCGRRRVTWGARVLTAW